MTTATARAPKTTAQQRKEAPGILYRTARVDGSDSDAIDVDGRKVKIAFSSESPVRRQGWEGDFDEVLVHTKKAVDLKRLNTSAPLLVNHDTDDQVGVVDHARIDIDDRVGRAVVRFSESDRGEEIFRDVQQGIRSLVSVGYRINETVTDKRESGIPVVRATSWEPFELSIVSIPADTGVGVGREFDVGSAESVGDGARQTNEEEKEEPMTNEESASTRQSEAQNATTVSSGNDTVVIDFDLEAERKSAAGNERARITEIQALKSRGWLSEEEANNAISEGQKLEKVREYALKRGPDAPQFVKPVGMSEKQVRAYSMLKAIRQAANKNEALDGFELEMHQEVSRTAPHAAEGFFVPLEVAVSHKRAIAASSGSEGNETVATELGELIELLRDNLIVAQLGATQMTGLAGNVQLPRHTATASSAWDAETDQLTESSQTFDTVTLSPKRAGVTTYYSKQLLIQSSLDVENFVRNDQARSLADTVEKGVLYGTGASDQPQGLVTDVQTNGNTLTFGGAASYTDYVDAWEQVASANAAMGSLAYLTTPPAVEKGLTLEAFTNTGKTLIMGTPGEGFSALGYPLFTVTTLTDGTDSNLLVFGNWQELIWATFGSGLDVVVDPYSRADRAQVVVTSNIFVDAATRHPASFTCSTDSAAQ